MVVTNLALYCDYKRLTRFLSAQVKRELQFHDIKIKIIRSQHWDAWNAIHDIYLKLCCDSTATSLDIKRIRELKAKVYNHTITVINYKGE